jgi:hypothetical protein
MENGWNAFFKNTNFLDTTAFLKKTNESDSKLRKIFALLSVSLGINVKSKIVTSKTWNKSHEYQAKANYSPTSESETY